MTQNPIPIPPPPPLPLAPARRCAATSPSRSRAATSPSRAATAAASAIGAVMMRDSLESCDSTVVENLGEVMHVPSLFAARMCTSRLFEKSLMEEIPEDAERIRSFKLSFIACESDIIRWTLVDDEELMDLLLSYVKHDDQRSTLSGYFSKGSLERCNNAAENLGLVMLMRSSLAAKVCASSFIGRFLHALQSSRPKSLQCHPRPVCIPLLDLKKLAYQVCRSRALVTASSEIVYDTVDCVGNSLKLLDIAAAESMSPKSYGCLPTPLGKHRLKGSIFHKKRWLSTQRKQIHKQLMEPFENGSEAADIALNAVDELLQDLDEDQEIMVENSAIVLLDGSAKQRLQSYVIAIVKFRLWNILRGTCLDASPLVKSDKRLHSCSPDGTFHYVVESEGRAIDIVFDGKQSWMKAILKDGEGSFQFPHGNGVEPYIPKDCHELSFEGTYRQIAPHGDPGKIPIGFPNLKLAVDAAHSFDGCETEAFRIALGTFVVHFGEAPKFHKVFQACCLSMLDNSTILSLHCYDVNLGKLVRLWGYLSNLLMGSLIHAIMKAQMLCLKQEKIPGVTGFETEGSRLMKALLSQDVSLNKDDVRIMKLGVPGLTRFQDILDSICIYTHSSMIPQGCVQRYFMVAKSEPITFHSIDPTVKGGEDKWITHFRVKCHEILGKKHERPPSVDPVVCSVIQNDFVMNFVNRNMTGLLRPNPWWSDLGVNKHHSGLSMLDFLRRGGSYRALSVRKRDAIPRSSIQRRYNFKFFVLGSSFAADHIKRGISMLKR